MGGKQIVFREAFLVYGDGTQFFDNKFWAVGWKTTSLPCGRSLQAVGISSVVHKLLEPRVALGSL